MKTLRYLPLSLALAVAACHAAPPPQVVPFPADASASLRKSAPPIHLTLVGTNDVHGWVYPHRTRLADGNEVEEGGAATFAGYLAVLRAQNPTGTLLLDGGDLFQGTLASNLTEGAVMIDAMNHLGYQASALGNHEFDYGPVGPSPVALAKGDDPFGALKARIKQAKFPLLAVNVYEAQSGQRPAWLGNDGTVMLDVGNVKVGVLGLITPKTPQTTNPINVASLRFGNLIPEALSAAKRLRDRGADVVVAVVHAGGKCPRLEDPKDLSSCDTHEEIFEMLSGISPGTLDAAIAGDTHAPMGHFVNGTPVIESWGTGTHFGTIDLYLDPVRKTVLPERTAIHALIPICARVDETTGSCDAQRLQRQAGVKLVPNTFLGQPVVKDAALEELLLPALARVEVEQNRRLGVSVPTLLLRHYEAESALGDVMADSLREMEAADVALVNSGGLRSDLQAGELRYGGVYEVFPFDNTLATLTLTGEELKRLLMAAYGARRGVYQQSGLRVMLSRCPGQERLKAFTLANGKPVLPNARYKVVMPDFLARGGDGLAQVMASVPPERVDMGMGRPAGLRDTLVAFWQKKGGALVAPRPGRTTFLDDGKGCSEGARLDVHARDR